MIFAAFDPDGYFLRFTDASDQSAAPADIDQVFTPFTRWNGHTWIEDRTRADLRQRLAAEAAEAAARLRYEYDTDGWYVGPHSDIARPNSTSIAPSGIPVHLARFVAGKWISDTSRETRRVADESAERTKWQQAVDAIKVYRPTTATDIEVRQTLGAALYVLRRFVQELRP